jgi:hypothetical protein
MRYALAVALVLGLEALSSVAAAQRGESTKDKPQSTTEGGVAAEEKPSKWAGSIVLFDQSATTQTIGLGKDYQSSNPTYEWWFALKPRYTFYDTGTTTMSANAWANLYLELTNSDTTTTEREPVLGPTLLWLTLGQTIFERGQTKTKVSIGPRVTLPTDKESRAMGRYLSLGASGGLTHALPINGKDAPALNSLRLEMSAIYGHAFTNSTTAYKPGLNQPRQDIGGRLVLDNQLGPSFLTHDSVSMRFGGDLLITPKLTFGLAYVLLGSWKYGGSDLTIPIETGPATVERIAGPTTFGVTPWALASLDYDVIDEMSLGIGYYNRTNQIGPEGQRRSPLWSPDARVFFTVTGNLDAIANHFTSKPAPPPQQTASAK